MGYFEFLGAILVAPFVFGFAIWYFWCFWTMFFVCHRPAHFFTNAKYTTSVEFFAIHVGLAIYGVACLTVL
jgi:hypothetical protein